MTPDTTDLTSDIAVENARSAFLNDDKHRTRYWARMALSIDPRCEDAWLLLAAVANPRASLGYFKLVLAINPENMQAKSGIKWASRRISINSLERIKRRIPTSPLEDSSNLLKRKNKTKKIVPDQRYSSRKLLVAIIAFFFMATFYISNQFTPAVFGLSPEVKPTIFPTIVEEINPQQTPIEKPLSTSTPTLSTVFPQNTALSFSTETPIPSPTPLPTDLPANGKPLNQNTLLVQDPQNIKNKWILVDISEQHMYVYESNNLVYSFVASTGLNNGTRTGTFAVQSKIPNAYGSTWNIWMPEWLGIYNSGNFENGIHALPIMADGSVLWDGYLGTPISYGCVVLGTYEAQLLYNWAEIGTPVIIQW